MNYKIINDEEALKEFIEWLPNLYNDECYYLTLFARKKYNSSIKSDKAQLKSFVTNKEYMLRKIKQLETAVGTYTFGDFAIPQDSLVLYISTPRSYDLAAEKIVKELVDDAFSQDFSNPYTVTMSALQTAKSSQHSILLFDIDREMDFIEETVDSYLNKEAYSLIKTRGGYRIIVYANKVKDQYKKSFYQKLNLLSDQTGDLFIPVIGCTQGGFTPYFIKK